MCEFARVNGPISLWLRVPASKKLEVEQHVCRKASVICARGRGTQMTGLFMQAFLTVRSLHSTMLNRARSEQGASMVEYALLVGLIAIVAVVAVTFLGTSIENLFNSAATNINSVNAG